MQELPEESVQRFARVEKLLRTQRTLPARLESVVTIARRTIPNCDVASISLIVEGEPTTSAVSDRLALEIDLVQYQTGDGPSVGTTAVGLRTQTTVPDAVTGVHLPQNARPDMPPMAPVAPASMCAR